MRNVLVVDDDPDIRTLVAYKLGQAGFTVHTAEDGEAGLRAALGSTHDLVLLDVRMPNLSGVEVCRRLREHVVTAATPVILLSAQVHHDEVARGLEAGADDYIVKPFSPRELLTRVRAVLDRGR